jgi:hypothetical protein
MMQVNVESDTNDGGAAAETLDTLREQNMHRITAHHLDSIATRTVTAHNLDSIATSTVIKVGNDIACDFKRFYYYKLQASRRLHNGKLCSSRVASNAKPTYQSGISGAMMLL